jgi:glutathione S-transferase
MKIVFYFSPMSSATRVHWALEELGVQYERQRVNLSAGEQRRPEFLALNPNGKVPLLVVEGQPIFESLAQLLYLAETYGVDQGLYPKHGPARTEALKWMCWGSVSLYEAMMRLMRNTSDRFPAEQRNDQAGAAARKDLADLFGILDRHLADKAYLLGSEFSLADVALATWPPYLGRLGVDLTAFKHIHAWVGRCMSRPALGRVLAG